MIVLVFVFVQLRAQDQWKNVYSESAWADRDTWQKTDLIKKYLAVRDGATVADIGCHEGYMTVKIAGWVGTQGRVYAVDLNEDRLSKLKQHLVDRRIENVTAIKGTPSDPLLPSTVDAVVIVDTYHEIKEHDEMLEHVWKSLKPGGRLVISEAIADSRRSLSREEQEKKHEISMSFVSEDLLKAGFRITYSQDPFVDREKIKGDKMWILVARKGK